MGRHEASSSPCIATMLVEEDPSYLRMTAFFNYVMGNLSKHGGQASLYLVLNPVLLTFCSIGIMLTLAGYGFTEAVA